MLPDDVGRLAAFEEPAEEQIQLLAGTDSLMLLRRNAAELLAGDGQDGSGPGRDAPERDAPERDAPERDAPERDAPERDNAARQALGSLALQADLPDHPILDRGRIIGLWQYDPGKERIVSRVFHTRTPAVDRRIAEVQAWIREDLGDFRAFSLDSPASRQQRIDGLAASAAAN
jgi:hypothetical protein